MKLALFLAGTITGAAALYLAAAVLLTADEATLLDDYLARENR